MIISQDPAAQASAGFGSKEAPKKKTRTSPSKSELSRDGDLDDEVLDTIDKPGSISALPSSLVITDPNVSSLLHIRPDGQPPPRLPRQPTLAEKQAAIPGYIETAAKKAQRPSDSIVGDTAVATIEEWRVFEAEAIALTKKHDWEAAADAWRVAGSAVPRASPDASRISATVRLLLILLRLVLVLVLLALALLALPALPGAAGAPVAGC